MREIKEELGLNIEIQDNLGENEYIASDPEAGKKRKQGQLLPGGIRLTLRFRLSKRAASTTEKWFRLQDALELNFYEDVAADCLTARSAKD